MRQPLRLVIVVASGVAVFAGASLFAVYRASQQVPEFYREAIRTADTEQQAAASKEMLRTATALVNDFQKEGTWEAEFTEDQINGWLAVDLVRNHGQVLPSEVSDPRVALRPEGAKIGWRWKGEEISTVFSVDVQLALAEPNVVALTIRGARAGTVPLPLSHILDSVSYAAQQLNLQLKWTKSGGHPVALITVPAPDSEDQKRIVVETLQLNNGAVYLLGRTVPGEEWSATRDWSAFLEQIGEHPREVDEQAEMQASERAAPSIQSAGRPKRTDSPEANRNVH